MSAPVMVPVDVAVRLLVHLGGIPEHRARTAVAKAIEPRPARPALERAITETATRWPGCRCPLDPAMTDRELVDLGAGCRAPLYACGRLDAVRRRVGL